MVIIHECNFLNHTREVGWSIFSSLYFSQFSKFSAIKRSYFIIIIKIKCFCFITFSHLSAYYSITMCHSLYILLHYRTYHTILQWLVHESFQSLKSLGTRNSVFIHPFTHLYSEPNTGTPAGAIKVNKTIKVLVSMHFTI